MASNTREDLEKPAEKTYSVRYLAFLAFAIRFLAWPLEISRSPFNKMDRGAHKSQDDKRPCTHECENSSQPPAKCSPIAVLLELCHYPGCGRNDSTKEESGCSHHDDGEIRGTSKSVLPSSLLRKCAEGPLEQVLHEIKHVQTSPSVCRPSNRAILLPKERDHAQDANRDQSDGSRHDILHEFAEHRKTLSKQT